MSELDVAVVSPSGKLVGEMRPPGSKSITNRALVCAALAQGKSTLRGMLDSDDTRVMIDCLARLGIPVQFDSSSGVGLVTGCGGQIPQHDADLFVGNSGTTIRFLTALCALGRANYRLDGVPRMRERPIGDLLTALQSLGINATSELGNNCPPVLVKGEGISGGQAFIRGDLSSQFLSGLLMAAPYSRKSLELVVQGELVSQPYVHMTLAVMKAFGVRVDPSRLDRFLISAPHVYQACDYDIEPDASAASYFWGAAAITQGKILVRGLARAALQGDVAFCDVLVRMGCELQETSHGLTLIGKPLRGIEVNMNAISDTVQTLAAVALFAQGPTTISGVAHIRHKETDRIGDLARELRKLGASVEEFTDGLRITPGPLRGTQLDTYDDHRMAMSLALVGLRVPEVAIRNPGCVAKTYPKFFDDLAELVASSGNAASA